MRAAAIVRASLAACVAGCLAKPPPPAAGRPFPDAPFVGADGGAADGGGADGGGGPHNVMFVTSAVFHPPLAAAVANGFCTQGANEHGHPGSFVAWMSYESTGMRAIDQLRTPGGGHWVRTDGALFANSADEIVEGMIANPPQYDEMGNDVLASDPSVEVATGTTAAGDIEIQRNGDCMNNAIEVGVPGATDSTWTEYGYSPCMGVTSLRLYCFGVGP